MMHTIFAKKIKHGSHIYDRHCELLISDIIKQLLHTLSQYANLSLRIADR